MMKPARHTIPKRPYMFGVSAAQVLRRADILRRLEPRKEVVVRRAEEWSITIDRRFADDARLMDVVILERIIDDAVGPLIAVMVAVGAAGAALRDFQREDLFAARDFCCRCGVRKAT